MPAGVRPASGFNFAHGCDPPEVLWAALRGGLATLAPHSSRRIGKGLGKALRAPERIGEDLAGCFDRWRGDGLPERIANCGDFGLVLLGNAHAFRLHRGVAKSKPVAEGGQTQIAHYRAHYPPSRLPRMRYDGRRNAVRAMKIFISWSGRRSGSFAEELKPWLEQVLPGTEVWSSIDDIDKGDIWFTEIIDGLKSCHCGVVCVTRENHVAPWLHFEAGGMVKGLGKAHVAVIALDMDYEELSKRPMNPSSQACRAGCILVS